MLATHAPETIAIDTDLEIAFSSGLHAGELEALRQGLGPEWSSRFMSEPMLAVEYIATMPRGRAEWYRRLQSTAWAMISEAFSGRVIKPGVSTTLQSLSKSLCANTVFLPKLSTLQIRTTTFYKTIK